MPRYDVGSAVAGVVARLVAAGLSATSDPRNTGTVPVVLVHPPDIVPGFGKWQLTYTADVIGPAAGIVEALTALSDVVDRAMKTTGAVEALAIDAMSIDAGPGRPAYQIRWTDHLLANREASP